MGGPHAGMIVAQVVDAAEAAAAGRLAAGDWRAATWAARQGLRAFPGEERLYRLLMRAAHTSGSTVGVRHVFAELLTRLADPDDEAAPMTWCTPTRWRCSMSSWANRHGRDLTIVRPAGSLPRAFGHTPAT